MFTVLSKGPEISGSHAILQGTSFGRRNEYILFDVMVPDIETPLEVKFLISEDPEYGKATVKVGDIVENSIAIKFLNIPNNGSAGINNPQALVAVGNVELSMIFQVESASKSDWFILHYCFFEKQLPEEGTK